MKFRLHHSLMALALAALAGQAGQAWAQDTKTVYALCPSDDIGQGKGIYTFELGDTIGTINLLQAMTYENVCGGLLMNDTYYYMEYEQVYNGYKTLGFYAYDMESKVVKQIADYDATQNGSSIASCLSYDYQTGTMYGLNSFNGGNKLVTIDLVSGVVASAGTLTFDYMNDAAQAAGYESMHVMTSTYDGDMYGVSYWGSLYKINQHTGACSYIATLDYNPGQAFMYTGDDLFYDNDNDKLYMRYTTYNWDTGTWLYQILQIDPTSGHTTIFADSPERGLLTVLTGVSVPFTVAEASAPAKVQNLTVTRGEKGALTATVDWDNPTKTYGRGGTLEDLDYVLVYRDGVLADSLTNPVIGGHMTWTDDKITERGYHTYKVVGGNDIGRGDRASVGTYIGLGDPKAVTDLTLTVNGAGGKLTWTAPTEGTLESYIDVSTLKYDIVRYKGSSTEGETVASDYTGTVYEDNSIEDMGKYAYEVTPKTSNAQGAATKTESLILGPAYTIPHTFAFASQDEFDLWTTHDANENGVTWQYSQGYYGQLQGATCSYYYDQLAAADWLVSPRVKFESGKRYKLTFDAKSGSKKVQETLAVSFGQGTDIAQQDSVAQFDIISDQTEHLRVNLPQVQTAGEYNVGFFYRSYMQVNYNLSIGNVQIAEDHEGYVKGTVTCNGKPVAGATVIANGGEFEATTNDNGDYQLDYLPAGTQTITVIAKGYEDKSFDVAVTEYETSNGDVALTALPAYEVKGTVVDVAGDPVANATITLSGYDDRETTTDAQGHFSFANIFKNSNYAIGIVKNKLVSVQKSFGVEADTDLGTITMSDNQKPAGKVTVTASETQADVTWKAPANDATVRRIDDGTLTTSVGIQNPTSNTLFGVVKREPSLVEGVQFYIDGTSSITHYSVQLYIFDLDEDGNPTDKILYQNTYVSATDGQWNSYTLPAPVDAPNGYYLAIANYNYMLVGIDGAGDSEKYPFVEGVNCFTLDYTTGSYYYLEGQSDEKFHHNFLIRPVASLYDVPEDSTEFTSNARRFTYNVENDMPQIDLTSKDYDNNDLQEFTKAEPLRTPQSRIRYNVYRMKTTDMADESKWTLLSEKQQARSYTDTDWATLEQGSYIYAVKAAYTGDVLTSAVQSDSIGNKMLTNVTYHLTTLTPDNEAYGAKVQLVAGGGAHVSTGYADEDGAVVLDDVWKGKYDVTISLDGFKTITTTADVSTENNYEFTYSLEEDRQQPHNLVIDEGTSPDSRLFIWNYADVFEDDFEGHDDFAVNSPGAIGWQYIDGDGLQTGGFSSYEWNNMFAPMAYIVFNASATTPSLESDYGLSAYSGNKCLQDWAAYGGANDDWLITPKLHFNDDIVFSFYARSYEYSYLESFEVLYSTTDTDPSSFITVQDSTTAYSYWQKYSYNIPKEARYIAIHCISNEKRIFSIDDVRYGLADAVNTPSYISRYTGMAKAPQKSAALDGLYEVYLDGTKVAQQDETEYMFTGLTAGKHTAGVLASYTSGKTEMSTIDFVIDAAGIASITGNGLKVNVDGRKLTIDGQYELAMLYSLNGAAQPMSDLGNGAYSLASVPAGVYVVNVVADGKTQSLNIILK